MSDQTLTTNIIIEVDGAKIPDTAKAALLESVVDQHVHLPDMFTLRLIDKELKFLDDGLFGLGKTVKISADSEQSGQVVMLIEGEITALEPEFGDDMLCELVVRGYDKSHRLFRETKSQAFLNKKDSDLAQDMASGVGLSAEISATTTVYEHIYQDNQSDLAFLMQRAWRIGFECYVSEGKLHFHKPASGGNALELLWGNDLRSFMPRMTLAEQVDEVIVRGWDVQNQAAIIGRAQASAGKLYPSIGESQNGAQLASTFGAGKLTIVDQPVVSQAEADILAQARLNEVSGTFVEAEGETFRRPDIQAGKMVKLKGLGKKLSGTYLVTQATHIFSATGLHTTFQVRGSRMGTLAEQVAQHDQQKRWGGVYVAVVTNADDPKGFGRIKVKYPYLTDDAESDWARVAIAGGGPDCGLYAIPDVGDEVLVSFEHGDINYPFVLGGLYNGKHAIPANAGSGGEQPQTRIFQSRTGHQVSLFDNADNKLLLETAGGHVIVLDDANSTIEINSSGGNTIVIDDNSNEITLTSNGSVKIEANQSIDIKASSGIKLESQGNIDIKSSGLVNIKGSAINLN